MRKNAKPLSIGLAAGIESDDPALLRLKEAGHQFYVADYDVVACDVIIGPRCWRIDSALGHLDKQLAMMIEGVRNIKYPKTKEAV
jgi:hypothetical protein